MKNRSADHTKMKKNIFFLFLLFWVADNISAQSINATMTWECQYILSKDSSGAIAMEKMQGIGSIKFPGDSTLSIKTLCNTGNAKLKMKLDGSMKIIDIAMTFVWCDEASKEAAFVKGLRNTSAFEINETGLKLYTKDKKGYMFFVSKK